MLLIFKIILDHIAAFAPCGLV